MDTLFRVLKENFDHLQENEDDDAGAAKKKRQNDDEQDYDESENESGDDQDEQDDSKDNENDVVPSKWEEGGVSELDYKNAREYVLSAYSNVREYEFDKENELWCKLTFDVSRPFLLEAFPSFH